MTRAAALRDAGSGVAVVVGAEADPGTRALAEHARALLGPDDAVVIVAPGEKPAWLDPSWLEAREPIAGEPTAWLCRGQACSLPARTPQDLALPPAAA
jgi:uncharacterized protein YyaL (SSP411 family)